MSGYHPQLGYISGNAAGGYLVAVPLLQLEATVPPERVFLMVPTTTPPPAYEVPPLTAGQEVVVAFIDGNLNMAAIIAARPSEG